MLIALRDHYSVIVTNLAPGSRILYFIDCKPVKATVDKGPIRAGMSNNHDLFNGIFACIRENNLSLEIKWMPSHTDEDQGKKKEIPSWLEQWHKDANQHVDTLAGKGASLFSLSKSDK